MHKRKKAAYTLLILVLTLLYSCGQGNKMTLEYFVNEDGSGKVEIDYESDLNQDEKLHRISAVDDFLKEESVGQQYLLNKEIKKVVEESEGVTRWDNVKYSFTEDKSSSERYFFKATAYFKDITKVDLEGIPDLEVSDFSKEGFEWSFPLKNSDNKKVNQLSKEQSLQKTKMLFSFLGSSLKVAFDRGLELNYIYNLPKKIKSSGTFKKSESNNRRAEFLFTEEYMNENAGRMKEVFERNKDSLVVPIDLINEVLFGSEEEKKIKMASGLFSGKAKNYVTQEEINSPSNYSIEDIQIPQIKEYEDLYIYKKGRYQKASKYDYITEHPSRISTNRTGKAFNGILFSNDARSDNLKTICEINNGAIDGAYWSFEDRDLSYKTYFQDGNPTFKTKLFRKDEPNKTVEAKTLEIKKKWSPLNKYHVASIVEDEKYVWITRDYYRFNLIRIHKNTKEIKVFDELNTPIQAKLVTKVVVDDSGKKWIGTDNGLYTYSEDKWEQVSLDPIYKENPRLNNYSFIRSIAFNTSDQSVWFALSESRTRGGSQLIQIDAAGNLINHTENIQNLNRNAYYESSSIQVHGEKLGFMDQMGNLWLYYYSKKQKQLKKLDRQAYQKRQKFVFDNNGEIWTLTRGTIRHFDKDLNLLKVLHNKDDKEFRASRHLLTCDDDRTNIYFRVGKSQFNKKSNQSDDYIVSYNVKTNNAKYINVPESNSNYDHFLKSKGNQGWFLKENGKIYIVDTELHSFKELKYYDLEELPKHYSLQKDEENKIYITDKGNKVYKLETNSETWKSFESKTPNSLEGEIISSSTERWFIPTNEDKNNSVIYFWKNNKWNQKDLPQTVKFQHFYNGIINNNGLFLVFKKRDEPYKIVHLNQSEEWEKISLPFETTNRITFGNSKNTLWVYKRKEGLFKLKPNNEWMGFSGSDEWSYVLSIHDPGQDELILSFDGYIMLKTAKQEWKKYNFLNTGIVFGRATDVIRDKENRLIISFQSNSEASSMKNSDKFTCNLIVYDQGDWEAFFTDSKSAVNRNYDYKTILLQDDDNLVLGTLNNGILKTILD